MSERPRLENTGLGEVKGGEIKGGLEEGTREGSKRDLGGVGVKRD